MFSRNNTYCIVVSEMSSFLVIVRQQHEWMCPIIPRSEWELTPLAPPGRNNVFRVPSSYSPNSVTRRFLFSFPPKYRFITFIYQAHNEYDGKSIYYRGRPLECHGEYRLSVWRIVVFSAYFRHRKPVGYFVKN